MTETLVDLQDQLATKEKALEESKIDHLRVSQEKKATERYLLQIKGECDFITTNIDKRRDNRAAEESSLKNAKEQLFATPAYKEAKAKEEKLKLGGCAEKCSADKVETAQCKACQEGVSVPGYCASHAGTPGC